MRGKALHPDLDHDDHDDHDDTTSEFQSHIPRHPLRIICLLPTALPSLEMQTIESINSEGLCFGGVAK